MRGSIAYDSGFAALVAQAVPFGFASQIPALRWEALWCSSLRQEGLHLFLVLTGLAV